MSWTDSRLFHSENGTRYEVIERGILGYFPFVVVVTNETSGIDEVFGEGPTRRKAFDDLRAKIGKKRRRKTNDQRYRTRRIPEANQDKGGGDKTLKSDNSDKIVVPITLDRSREQGPGGFGVPGVCPRCNASVTGAMSQSGWKTESQCSNQCCACSLIADGYGIAASLTWRLSKIQTPNSKVKATRDPRGDVSPKNDHSQMAASLVTAMAQNPGRTVFLLVAGMFCVACALLPKESHTPDYSSIPIYSSGSSDSAPSSESLPSALGTRQFVAPGSNVMTEEYRRGVTDQMVKQGADRVEAEAFTKTLNDLQRGWERKKSR